MAIDAKVSLQQQLENRLMTEVTADTMNRMLRIIADVLEGFDVREIAPEEDQDDLLDCYMNAMRVQGRSEKTLHRYKYIIEKMMKEVGVSRVHRVPGERADRIGQGHGGPGRPGCVVHGKGNKERRVYLDGVTGMLIRAYLAERQDFNPALFVNRYHDRMKADGVREMLTRLEKATGVEHVHPHKFRRTLATNMARKGMPVQEVARILGHDKIDTTMQYVMLDDEDIKHRYRKFA